MPSRPAEPPDGGHRGTGKPLLGSPPAVRPRVRRRGRPVPRLPEVSPGWTGFGDAFRAGFLAGLAWEPPHRSAAELGCAFAAVALESVGTQEYKHAGVQARRSTSPYRGTWPPASTGPTAGPPLPNRSPSWQAWHDAPTGVERGAGDCASPTAGGLP
ncbi:PfkB family carbohydrate kinase [Streptomyces eurythermus]|uniref:PfkB family carbohydrate kinase n=1 Tax=Streptomyces eurythermus TaxID=42237 RepID=UPI00370181FB